MKTVVFAYHDMGCLGIEALLAAGYEISAIFTHTDNPGEKAFYGSVARLAAERGIPVYAPDDVNHPLWVERIAHVLIHLKYEKTGRTLDYSGSDGIRFGGACKPVAQILVVNQ